MNSRIIIVIPFTIWGTGTIFKSYNIMGIFMISKFLCTEIGYP